MQRKPRRYKDVIRDKVVSIRLSDEEFLRLKANALRDKTSMSRMLRERITEITQA